MRRNPYPDGGRRGGAWQRRIVGWIGGLSWFVAIALPLGWLYVTLRPSHWPQAEDLPAARYALLLVRSVLVGCAVATTSVVLGWPAARLIGASPWARKWAPLLLMLPLLIPPQVLYYAWGLLLLPTTWLGQLLTRSDTVAAWVALLRGATALGCWYWPLCALVIGQGWRRTDPDVWAQSKLEGGALQRWWWVGLPLLRSAIVSAWLLAFLLSISEFSVFHLGAVDTLGTEFATLYQLTGSPHAVAWAVAPLAVLAVLGGVLIDRFLRCAERSFDLRGAERVWSGWWVLAGAAWMASAVVPALLLIANVRGWRTFVRFGQLSWDGLLYSTAIAIGAAGVALLVGVGILVQMNRGHRRIAMVMRLSAFFSALVPGSLVAAAMVLVFNRGVLADHVYSQPWVVSLGHGARLAVLAVLVIQWVRASLPSELRDLANLDGADGLRGAFGVWLPGMWPALAAAAVLTVALSITEVSATMVLLPPGVPSFAQSLLNQMHYARDQQVIASCILLILVGAVVAGVMFALVRLATGRGIRKLSVAAVLIFVSSGLAAGCDEVGAAAGVPRTLTCFGTTGRGHGQFIYPRAIALAADGMLLVVDKTGRVQRLDENGEYHGGWTMPQTAAGKPVGLSCARDGNVYVADTHYHRVMVYSPAGVLQRQFGKYGTGPGEFIYPTDAALAPDGRIFVSEYGGNDRISIFSHEGEFIRSFGSFGEGENQFARPAALCVDGGRRVLYVADACNHRIARYDLAGNWLGVIGGVGRAPGKLRYPYDVNLLPDGSLIVCEYGNNRVQRFSADGRSLGTWGRPGGEPGQLRYPWGVVVDGQWRAFIVDSGNDRIQVWRLQ